jgi:predicted rRNA methylase YqxC with S4 and FtsJ domains
MYRVSTTKSPKERNIECYFASEKDDGVRVIIVDVSFISVTEV